MKLPKYCNVCGEKLLLGNVGNLKDIQQGYDQFTGKQKQHKYFIEFICPVMANCGSWYAEQRNQASADGTYLHFHKEVEIELSDRKKLKDYRKEKVGL